MAKNDDEIQTADYKTTASGKKVRAHRIVFNKGEEDSTKIREECMTKSYKSFVAKYGKNRAVKEEVEQLDELSNDTIKAAIKVHAQKATHHASAAEDALDRHRETDHDSDYEEHEHHAEREEHHMNKIAKLKSKLKEEAQLEEGWDDMVAHGKKTAAAATKTSTATKHDVKKTSTGTVYTKQRDADGNSKEFKRDTDEAKRGRGRPKKNSFSEAAEFLMSLDEATFDSLMEDGFDTFAEQFEQLDELSKTTLGNYVKKAANDKADTAFHRGYSAYNNSNHKPYSEPMKNKVHKGQENRNKGIKRAINRLTK